jgi:hypothetical protein
MVVHGRISSKHGLPSRVRPGVQRQRAALGLHRAFPARLKLEVVFCATQRRCDDVGCIRFILLRPRQKAGAGFFQVVEQYEAVGFEFLNLEGWYVCQVM